MGKPAVLEALVQSCLTASGFDTVQPPRAPVKMAPYRCLALALSLLSIIPGPFADDSTRTPEERVKASARRQGTPGYGVPRPPGTLLLNMLIKNEAEHLDRTLPKWANIIDYWIIGVDDANTDNSPAIIKKHLGHIPGDIVMVHFDGMGPTWSVLVQHGIDHFPDATHGIVADADFAPMNTYLDKMELDIRCSKHMYTVWTQDHRNERKMDWIYRNIQGAQVKRRTHQTVEVPELPDQEVFQTLINLPVDEREGGYQDRTPGKNERYIGFLLADLDDYPDDTRTLYYLGYAHYDNFKKVWELRGEGAVTANDWAELEIGVGYMLKRRSLKGNKEERWFTILKLGEVYERYYRDWSRAEQYYTECTDEDGERADAWFYLGQHYRLVGDHRRALPYLKIAATLNIPERSLFQWHYLYHCLSKLEYGRSLTALSDVTLEELKEGRSILRMAKCHDGDPGNMGELTSLQEVVQLKIDEIKRAKRGSHSSTSEKARLLRRLVALIEENLDDLEEELDEATVESDGAGTPRTLFAQLLSMLAPIESFASAHRHKGADPSCREYRRATTPYLRFFKRHHSRLDRLMEDAAFMNKWQEENTRIRAMCR